MISLLKNRVLVKRIPIPEQTRGGIILPLKAIELPQLAHIKAIGPKNPDNLSVGDLVLIKKFEGFRLWLDGEELHLLFINDLICQIKE